MFLNYHPRSPAIDIAVFFSGARLGRWRRADAGHDPSSRVGWIDHIVNTKLRGIIQRLTALIHGRDHLVKFLLSFRGIVDRGELVAIAELHRALESHRSEFAGWPRHAEQRRVETSGRHRNSAEA